MKVIVHIVKAVEIEVDDKFDSLTTLGGIAWDEKLASKLEKEVVAKVGVPPMETFTQKVGIVGVTRSDGEPLLEY